MACDETTDDNPRLIPLSAVPRLKWLPRRRGGSRLAISTVHRWANPTRPIHLKTIRVGGSRCTRRDWLHDFFERLAAADAGRPCPVDAHTPARRARDLARAAAELAASGIA